MKLVTRLSQIAKNIDELERGRKAGHDDLEEYRGLIRRGVCFLPYESQLGISFAPSRFIGYIGNKLSTHANNPNRDGRVTNEAINKILNTRPIKNANLEKVYQVFCGSLGLTTLKTGAFGVQRKYWITSDVLKLIENQDVVELIENQAEHDIAHNTDLGETVKQQLIKARVGQGLFRKRVIDIWKKCCVTECEYVEILRASHIKPWAHSSNKERLDEFNGLLLTPNFDALFDKGLITFTDEGKMLISELLSASDREKLGCFNSVKVSLKPEHAKYMKWHRGNIFVGDMV